MKKRLFQSSDGLAVIEALGVLALSLPILLLTLGLIDYLTLNGGIRDAVRKATGDSNVRAFALHTGDQGYYLVARDSCRNSDEYSHKFWAELDAAADSLEADVQNVLGCFNCQNRYRIELRYLFFRVNTATGHVAGLRYEDCQRGRSGNHFRIRGALDEQAQSSAAQGNEPSLLDAVTEAVTGEARNLPTPARYLPSPGGVYGVTQKQYYGSSANANEDATDPINYLRFSLVIAAKVEVDLSGTPAESFYKVWESTGGFLSHSNEQRTSTVPRLSYMHFANSRVDL